MNVLVCGGNPAGHFLIPEEPDQRRPLQRFFFIRIVTLRAVGLKHIATAELLCIERPRWSSSFSGAAGKSYREKDLQREQQ